ncbi:MAG: ATP-binding protein [Trichlorobacter sp.]|nr:ATP-binding protein [Trichlorobacter sp.]
MNPQKIKELLILSGKGGTGKTSVTASFAMLAEKAVLADCDVDAADLHLILTPQIKEQHRFICGNLAVIRQDDCISCNRCLEVCRFKAVSVGVDEKYSIDPASCEGCGVCVQQCVADAIDFPERDSGCWMISDTRCGVMVHAQLAPAAENSGKLVTLVRDKARQQAEQNMSPLIISDGPPGIGCPVIASLSGVSFVLVITEPSVSGLHDLKRVLALAKHFSVPAAVCVNKWDINPQQTKLIEEATEKAGAVVAGRICFDSSVTNAQLQGKAAVEFSGKAADDIKNLWSRVVKLL